MSATADDPAIAWAMGGGQGAPAAPASPPAGSSDDPAISFAASGGARDPIAEQGGGFMLRPDSNVSAQSDQPLQGAGAAGLQTAAHVLDMPGKAVTGFAVRHGVDNPYAAAAFGVLPDLAEDTLLGGFKGVGDAKAILAHQSPFSPQFGRVGQTFDAEVQPAGRSAGAAAATPNITQASPELQDAVRGAAQETGGIVNQDALARHLEADSLPVPVKLSRGQATQDPQQLSLEMNRRGQSQDLANHFNDQNGKLVQNIQELRDRVGPEVFTTNPVEHGDTLIEAYKAKAAAADADIASRYQALKDANGGDFPVDVTSLKANVDRELNNNYLYEHAPSAEMSQLQKAVNSGKMSFQQFEAMRTNLARIMRSSSDGNERAAAGVIRQQMEELPMGGATQFKGLADSARSAARAQFQALDADPAYKAAVNDSVTPDRFVSRFIVNGSRDDVATMKANFADNPQAQQTMSVAALDHLRKAAGIDSGGMGNFAQATFNRNLEALGPKMGSLFDPKTADDLQTLGNVARYTQFQPRGSWVNNSNSTTAAMAELGKGAVEHMVNAKTAGFGGTLGRKILQGREAKAFARDALAPGAGLTDVEAP